VGISDVTSNALVHDTTSSPSHSLPASSSLRRALQVIHFTVIFETMVGVAVFCFIVLHVCIQSVDPPKAGRRHIVVRKRQRAAKDGKVISKQMERVNQQHASGAVDLEFTDLDSASTKSATQQPAETEVCQAKQPESGESSPHTVTSPV